MHAEDLVLYQGGWWQTVEHITKLLPQFDVVATLALVVEAINSCDARALMVTTEQEYIFWVLHLVRQKQIHHLNRVLTTIDVVAKHQIVGIWWKTSSRKVLEQIVELAMNVGQYLDRSIELQKSWLSQEFVPCSAEKTFDVAFWNLNELRTTLIALRAEKLMYDLVNIHVNVAVH